MRRRRVLQLAGLSATAGSTLLAGCSAESAPLPADEFPAIDEWLTETEVGGADGTYDGTIVDRRGASEVRVDVGVDGNGGTYAYDPSAVAVSPGTTVRWVWVDDQEGHNVAAAPDRQLGASDYEFRSGGPVAEEGHEYSRSLDREGVALYHCEGVASAAWNGMAPPPRGRSYARGVGGVGEASGPVLHLESHRDHGMKGGIAVTE
jgi:halocyanin-like protein